jgi:hypothetical protein
MRGARARALPGVAGQGKRLQVGKTFHGNKPLKRGKPMVIVGLAGIGIAGRLGFFDFLAERRGPFLRRNTPRSVSDTRA